MKLLHTADWHIGKTLAGYDRTAEFEAFFGRLVETLDSERPDILIVAGDVFDTATPSNSVANMYYNLINTLHAKFPALHIVITSGNHDSPSYLNAPKEILKFFGADVVGSVIRNDGEVDFPKMVFDFGNAIVCAVPYLRRGDIVSLGGENPSIADFYRGVLDYALSIRADRDIPIIGTGHLTTIGATYNKTSEISISATRDDSVGGLENIDPQEFPDEFSYIALGHIHKPQKAGDRDNIRYSGSPIPFSFSEKDYRHSFSVVEFCGKVVTDLRFVELPHIVKLRYVPEKISDFETVKRALSELPDDEEMFIEVNLEYAYRNAENKSQIINEVLKDKKVKFCGFRLIDSNNNNLSSQESNKILSVEQLQTVDPMDIVSDIYKQRLHTDKVSDRHAGMLREIIEEIGQ